MTDFASKCAWAFAQMIGTTLVFRVSDNGFDSLAAWLHTVTGLPMGWLQ